MITNNAHARTHDPPSSPPWGIRIKKKRFCRTNFCLFVLANQMQASKTQIFGYLWHLLFFSNAFFKAQMWQKAEEYVPK